MQKADSNQEFYFKGIYPVEVLSGVQDGLVEVRAKTTFLHTSAYSEGKRQVRVGVTEKRWVRRGGGFEGTLSSCLVASTSYTQRDIFDHSSGGIELVYLRAVVVESKASLVL